MKKEIIIGLGALAIGGAIMGGVIVARNPENPFNIEEKQQANETVEDKEKIEELWIDDLKDDSRYGFCLAEVSINTNYSDPVLQTSGTVEYTSKEVLLYKKEAQKFYIMSRQADYKYKGVISMSLGGIAVNEPVNEVGKIDENYDRNEMPLRLDYANKYIYSNPDTKENTWVSSSIGDETDKVMPHHGCASRYSLDNAPSKDILAGNEQILIDRDCKTKDINGVYDGDFIFKCRAINHSQAMEMIDTSRKRQELQDTKDTSVMEDSREAIEEKADASASAQDDDREVDDEIREAIEGSKELTPDDEEIKKQLEQFREAQADQKER